VFNDHVTGSEVRAYKSLVKFESRDNESIQVSANVPDGKIQVWSSLPSLVVLRVLPLLAINCWRHSVFCLSISACMHDDILKVCEHDILKITCDKF